MKKSILFLLCAFLFQLATMQAQGLQALYAYSTFLSPDGKPYVEISLSFSANSLKFVEKGNKKYGATVEITTLVKKNDSVFYATKRNLNSPEITTSDELNFSFMDLQRIGLGNGIYDLEILLKDKSTNDTISVKVTDKINIYYPGKQLSLSDIQFLESIKPTTQENVFSKHGFDMVPYINDYVPAQMEKLTYYYEIYNTVKYFGGENKPFIVYTYIENYLTGVKLEDYQWSKVEKVKELSTIANILDIKTLPSGNYNFVVELRDTSGAKLTYKKLFFERNNPGYDQVQGNKAFAQNITSDSLLLFYIKSLDPIATSLEQSFIRHKSEKATLEEKQAFFDGFWISRNPEYPEIEWRKYNERVSAVEAKFGFKNRPGYATDRGIIYLKYGPPDNIIDEKYATSDGVRNQGRSYLPYQMWRYNMLPGNKSKSMFVFWSRQFNTYDYELLHSNVIGEVSDPQWEQRLSRGTVPDDETGYAYRQFERGY